MYADITNASEWISWTRTLSPSLTSISMYVYGGIGVQECLPHYATCVPYDCNNDATLYEGYEISNFDFTNLSIFKQL